MKNLITTIFFSIFTCAVCSAQDIIMQNDGTVIKAKILEISQSEIKYKRFDYIDGPTLIISKSDINYIKYPNGSVESLNNTIKSKTSQSQTNIKLNRDTILKTYYPTGELLSETPYINGKMNGTQKLYYKTGAISSETPFVDGLANGVSKVYYKNGRWMYEIPYIYGNITGILRYQPYKRMLIRILNEVKFVENKGYYPSGEIYETIPKGNGIINGTINYYRKTGELYATYPHINNVAYGKVNCYHKNGNVNMYANYVDGEDAYDLTNVFEEVNQGLQQGVAYENMLSNTNSQTVNDYTQIAINNYTKPTEEAVNSNNQLLQNSTPTINDTYNKISDNTVNAESSASTNGGQNFNTNAAASKKCAAETEANWKETLVYKDFENDKLCMKKSYKAILKLTEMLLINCGQYLPPAEKEGYNKTISSLTNQINNTPDCVALIFETPKQGTKNNNKPKSQTQQPAPSGKNTNIAQ